MKTRLFILASLVFCFVACKNQNNKEEKVDTPSLVTRGDPL